MPIYKAIIEGVEKTFNLPDDKVEGFLSQYPNAVEVQETITDEGKQKAGVKNQIADAPAENEDTELQSVESLSDSLSPEVGEVVSYTIQGKEYSVDQIKSLLGTKIENGFFNGKNKYPDTIEEFVSAYGDDIEENRYNKEVVVVGSRLSDPLQAVADQKIEELPEKADELFSADWEEKNMKSYYGIIPDGPNAGTSGGYMAPAVNEERVKFIDEARKIVEAEKFGSNLITEDQVLEKAKELYKKDKEKNIATEVVEAQLAQSTVFSPETLKENARLKIRETNIAKGNEKFDNEAIEDIKNRFEKIQETAKNTTLYAQNLNKQYSTEEELEAAKLEYKGYTDDLKILQELQDKEFEKLSNISDSKKRNAEALDIVKRNYGGAEIFAGALAASAIDIASGLYATPRWLKESVEGIASDIYGEDIGIPDWMTSMAGPGFDALFGNTSKEINDYLGNISENIRGGIAKPIKVEDLSNVGQVGNWLGNLVGSQMPIMATMLTLPNASLAMLGSSAAGGKFLEMEKEIDNGQQYSGLQLFAAPAMVGAAEYLTERISLSQLNRVVKGFRGEEALMDGVKNYLGNSYLRWARDMGLEGGAEVAAAFGENIADRLLLGKKDVSMTRGMLDGFASGAVMSGFVYKFPYAGASIVKAISGTDVESEIRNGNNLIKSLSKELENPKLSLEEKNSIENNITDIRLKQTKILKKSIDGWDNLNKTQQKRLFEIDGIANNVFEKAGRIARGEGNYSKLSIQARQDKVDILADRYDSLKNEKNSIISLADEKNFDGQTFALQQFEQEVVKGSVSNEDYLFNKSKILTDRLNKLYEKRNKATVPAEIKFLDKQIKNTEDQMQYIVPKAAGLSIDLFKTTIAKAKTNAQLGKAFVAKSQELLAQKNKKEITPEQYQRRYKLAKNAFENKRNEIREAKKESTAEKYNKLQEFYDRSLDENGNFIENTKTTNEFERIAGGIVESATKRLYDNIPKDLRKISREQFKKNLTYDAFLMINREKFDPSIQSLDRFISNRLNFRANRTAKESADQDGFKESISENPNLGASVLEDVQEQEEARQALNTAKAMQIPDSIINKARKAAVSALSTISNKVDATKFKSEIAKTIKDALYSDLKNLFGKDTKTNKAFTKNLIDNIRPFYNVLTVESMRKARNNKTGINPFVELGLLDANGNKVAFENIDQQAFINFYTGKDKAKGTMSDRRMNLIEAVASSLGAAQAIDLLNNDAGVREKFLSRQAQENEIANKGLDLLVPKAFRGFINVLKDLAQATSINSVAKLLGLEDITVNDTNRFEKQQAVLNAIKKYGLTPNVFEAAMPASSGAFRSRDSKGDVYYDLSNGKKIIGSRPAANLSQVDKNNKKIFNLPTLESIENEFGKGVTLVASRYRLYYGKTDPAYITALAAAEKNLKGKEELKPQRVLSNFFSKASQSRSDVNMDVLEDVAIQLNDAVKNGMPKEIAALIIAQGYQASGGLIKIAAKFKYKSKVFEFGIKKFFQTKDSDKPYREEHNPPASLIGANLIWAISNDKVRDLMPYIRKNYYQTQLSKRDDERLDLAKLGGTLPQGSTILDNPIVRLAQAGTNGNRIDLNSIINPLTGKTIAEENNVQSASTPDAVAASNAAAVENNTDQVENLIDRAIAKLIELTGDNGTLQMNFGAVPINVLVGGLRATKLAYQGGKALVDAISAGYGKVKNYMTPDEWTNFVGKSTYEVRNENNPAQVRLSIMNEDGIAKLQEQVRQGNYNLLKEFGVEIDGLTTDQIIEKINILRKAKVVGSNTKAPKKKARVFDFDDTLAKTNSKVLYTFPDTTTQELTGTGDAFAIRTIIYNEVLNAISKNPNIERLRFSSDAREPSRVKLYDFITKKLSKDLGWQIDNYETSFLDEPSTQDFELVRPKNGGKKIKTKGKYNLTEDEAGNLNTNFVINGKTYDVNINNKDGENKADFEVEFSLNIPGETGSLDATQFAEQYNELQEAGATFDYSEFNQVKDGSKGPLATLAKRFTEAKGDRDVFVLTARPAEAATAIQEFLRATLGISIPLQNITGLANGKPGAKAMWVAEKVSEGYNDVFFADDSKANVDAVARMLDNLGVTKRVQQAKESGQRNLEDEMDSLIRGKKRSKIGKFLSKFNIYIPPGADDFAGLLKYFQAKGKLGNEQMKWFQENLLTPFAQGISAYTTAKVTLANDFKEVNKRFKNYRTLGVPSKFRKMLSQEVLGGIYTNEQAVRAYLYDKAGQDLGINKADTQDLIALVEGNSELKAYAEEISKITKLQDGYPPITEQWLGGSIATDMAVVSNRAQRAEFLQEFTNNKNQIFSDQNMKLIKQIYGNDYADALSNILERMETGQNRKKGKDKEFNSAMNWINQSVGAVMSINLRSAILQQLSIVNYMNWNFNNPIKMGLAMANVPQFMKDYLRILNSDFLKERRGGMAIEVNLADIADSNPGNLFLRLNKKVLELGFKPTQWGDSNAIAFGGATWYRNRYNQLIEQGLSESEADAQAMLEFQEVSETAQQSSRVDKVSRQQASDIGRLILAFANTPLQYARETRKATLDLVNGRGDWKTNASKILYYGIAQNIIFTGLQQALFSLLLGEGDDEEKDSKKISYAVNNVLDGVLRGMGYAGAVIAALKNLGMEYYDQRQKREKGERVYDGSLKLVQKGLSISPPISKKIGDIVEAQKFETWRQYKSDPFYQAFAYANYVSGLTNLPIDRVFKKIENLKAASQDSTEAWQSVFLSLGWSPYNVGVDYPPKKNKNKGGVRLKSSSSRASSRGKGSSGSALNKALPKGVLGRANNDGTIEIDPSLKGKQKEKVVAHEKKHIADMKSGKLNYDDNFVYWKGNKHKRINDKIEYNGKKYLNGSSKLPWEAAANKVEKQIS